MNQVSELKRNINQTLRVLSHPYFQLDAVQELATEFRESEPIIPRKIYKKGEQVIRVVERKLTRQINN